MGQLGTLSPEEPLKKKKKSLTWHFNCFSLRKLLKENKTKQLYLDIPTMVLKILGSAKPMFLNHFSIIIPPKGVFRHFFSFPF